MVLRGMHYLHYNTYLSDLPGLGYDDANVMPLFKGTQHAA